MFRKVAEVPAPLSGTRGFVPTMGAFHEGHLELMRRARRDCDEVAVSLFVNPKQFAAGEDFDRYPRDEERDLALAEAVGVDWVFAPDANEMYPRTDMATVRVGRVGSLWEGAARPGHFDGVATVVLKLFAIVRPDVAYFGLKDYQQCIVVRTMKEDFNLPLSLKFVETVREPDGLAMSSRNAYLSPEERKSAPALYKELQAAARALKSEQPLESRRVAEVLQEGLARLEGQGFQVDYFALVDEDTLEPWNPDVEKARLIVAGRLGATRLIDNCTL